MRLKITAFFTIFLLSSLASADSGKEIFDRYCTACHSPSMASIFNSPPAHDTDAWNMRKENAFNKAVQEDSSLSGVSLEKKSEIGINMLVKSAVNGLDTGMPPMGTCTDCTEDDLKSAIIYMSSPE
jgi:cytochrome c5